MKLTKEWMEANSRSTMGCDDERVFIRMDEHGNAQVAYWAYDNIKLLTITGIMSISDDIDLDFDESLEEIGDCFEIVIAVDGGTIVAIDSSDTVILGDGYNVIDSEELNGDELFAEYPELAAIFEV